MNYLEDDNNDNKADDTIPDEDSGKECKGGVGEDESYD